MGLASKQGHADPLCLTLGAPACCGGGVVAALTGWPGLLSGAKAAGTRSPGFQQRKVPRPYYKYTRRGQLSRDEMKRPAHRRTLALCAMRSVRIPLFTEWVQRCAGSSVQSAITMSRREHVQLAQPRDRWDVHHPRGHVMAASCTHRRHACCLRSSPRLHIHPSTRRRIPSATKGVITPALPAGPPLRLVPCAIRL
jgi:hypothetical protein